ncbi:type II toxin-antitoxin system RelE/ParE family toxin [Candidatus Saccharibacteria bacterium]|nr:MAG: type II toxin-antitoxin system RelE/ParE family toxin [Candidatus Saccharibacteria bacterium]
MYGIEFSRSADKELNRLPVLVVQRVMSAIEGLAYKPRPSGVKKMHGFQSVYRIRVGDYRVIYEIKDGFFVVLILEIGHRKHVYRGF